MRPSQAPRYGSRLLTWLKARWGISESELQRIGALVVGWALFEHRLEQAIWRLRGDDLAGRRPDTDTMPASDRIKLFRSLSATIGVAEWHETAALFCDTCENVLFVRNVVAHGHLLPAAVGGGVINNVSWHGVVRKRPFQSLHVTE